MRLKTNPLKRMAALLLALTLLSGAALAANTDTPEARLEDLNALYDTLRDTHPNLFANTPEAEFEARKAEIEGRLATESYNDFVLDLQSLAALAKDSHTSVRIGVIGDTARYYPFSLTWMDGKWILSAAPEENAALLGAEVTAMNGLDMDAALLKFGALLSYDNPVSLRKGAGEICYVADVLAYVGITEKDGPLTLSLRDSAGRTRALELGTYDTDGLGKLSLAYLSGQRKARPATAGEDAYYIAKPLDDGTYYIQYNICMEAPDLTMEAFCEAVQKELDAGSYERILIDLRYNGGGSDGVLYPMLLLLREEMQKGTEVVGLIGESTFSSAIINSVELSEMGVPLVGEATAGSVNHFGEVYGFTLPNSGVQAGCSLKYIDLGTMFDAAAVKGIEPLVPDAEVPQTMADYLAGRDSAVEYILAHEGPIAQTEQPNAALTRGRFVGMLYEAAGSPAVKDEDHPFADSFGLEWYIPALNWALETGVARGTGDGMFASSRKLTWQEAAAFIVRAADALGQSPEKTRGTPAPEALLDGAWDAEALETVWSWGLIPEAADFSAGITRAQGETMVSALIG